MVSNIYDRIKVIKIDVPLLCYSIFSFENKKKAFKKFITFLWPLYVFISVSMLMCVFKDDYVYILWTYTILQRRLFNIERCIKRAF